MAARPTGVQTDVGIGGRGAGMRRGLASPQAESSSKMPMYVLIQTFAKEISRVLVKSVMPTLITLMPHSFTTAFISFLHSRSIFP